MSPSVIIKRCATLNEAYILRELLRSNGFEVSIDEENHAAVNWWLVPALNGVAIRLPRSQAEDAKAIVVTIAKTAPADLDEQFGIYESPRKYGRVAIWFMILFQIGVVHIVGSVMIYWLITLIPPEWIPDPSYEYSEFPIAIGHVGVSFAPPGPGIDGLIFMFLLMLLLGIELLQTRPTKPPREPQP